MIHVQFLGGARTVTGSATLLENRSWKCLIDCGLFQGGKEVEKRNFRTRPYHPRDLSFILLTHAHIDHSGLLPRLVREGFRGKVVCTGATFDLCQVMLRDSAHIQEMEAEWQNRKNRRSGGEGMEPLYTLKDAERSLHYFLPIPYRETLSLADGLSVRFQDAGHILGSAIIEVWVEVGTQKKKLVFSGDLGSSGQPIVKDPTSIREADLLWLESTYGDRLHKSKEETEKELLGIVQEAIRDQGKVIIPAFAIERTQEIIYTIGRFMRQGLLPSIPIYIDSPLAISATEIFKRHPECFDGEMVDVLARGEDPLALPEIHYTRTTEESKAINEDQRPGIIISASGMCDSGRIKHHLKHHLWKEKSHIVFVGYQGEGTVGRRLVDGAQSIRLFGEEIAVRAKVHTLGGFSAHADQKGLLDWLSHFENPDLEVFVNHGEEKASLELARQIRERFSLKVSVPRWQERRTLFGPEGSSVIEEEVGPEERSEEKLHDLLKHLDRNYKRLRKKFRSLRRRASEEISDPRQLRQLEEVNRRIEELVSEL
ncbi:MAG: MBL fold metallo-hydrolase [Desulfobacterota bacterium]|nr:MBL fold metallo-hydrolase [Thermodesulfobacteriota bacterium]